MNLIFNKLLVVGVLIVLSACSNGSDKLKANKTQVDTLSATDSIPLDTVLHVGAERFEMYLPLLKNKKVALLTNHTGRVGDVHLVDTLLELDVEIVRIFAPEHGFRGTLNRGKQVEDSHDPETGLPIVGMVNRKPADRHFEDLDVVIFDIQDVGARFFTYISTMHLMMECCAKHHIHFIVLDRPNPLGDQVDGPVRKAGYESFVGKHPIPVVHGLTVGELAQMIIGEAWLEVKDSCQLTVIPVKNYTHKSWYEPPLPPSPNLTNMTAIRLYPSLCFFEATKVSVGRGTTMPFQVLGFPDERLGHYSFVPKSISEMQANPVQEGKTCYGLDLRHLDPKTSTFTLSYLWQFAGYFQQMKQDMITRPQWFDLLAGNSQLRQQLQAGLSIEEVRASWQQELQSYKALRKKYLLYEDF